MLRLVRSDSIFFYSSTNNKYFFSLREKEKREREERKRGQREEGRERGIRDYMGPKIQIRS